METNQVVRGLMSTLKPPHQHLCSELLNSIQSRTCNTRRKETSVEDQDSSNKEDAKGFSLNKARKRRKRAIRQCELRQMELKEAKLRGKATKQTGKVNIQKPIMMSPITKLWLVQQSYKLVKEKNKGKNGHTEKK